ncbi:hypothetical protein HHI36_004677 [Cryptolaemus montrouzieri]|uniref:Daxx histone-binding domain-containing protein n=1 Tax=Cryptolaemus montrouzieri TaxID=559131 RepID=A0ABD2NSB7_9CUCU
MNKIVEKLEELNEAEIDFDDEVNSTYLKHDKYSQRLCQIYKNINPYTGRITHDQLDFVSSHYDVINLAICKKYKNNSVFPSYDELTTFIQKLVDKNELSLSSTEIQVESKHCFQKLGDLLQLRRKRELYEAHSSHILDKRDPAEDDKTLDAILQKNLKEAKKKFDQVCEEFVKKQELGTNKEEIDCSDTNDENEDNDEADKNEENHTIDDE